LKILFFLGVAWFILHLWSKRSKEKNDERVINYLNMNRQAYDRYPEVFEVLQDGRSEYLEQAKIGMSKIDSVLLPDEQVLHSGLGFDDINKRIVYVVTSKRFIYVTVAFTSSEISSVSFNKIMNVKLIEKMGMQYVKIIFLEGSVEFIVNDQNKAGQLFAILNEKGTA
jgi:hypothetical protein